MAGGKVRRESLPSRLTAREGTAADLELAAEVDRAVRGAPHGPDLEFMLRTGVRLLVVDGPEGCGYAVVWEGSRSLLAATTPAVATDLLWSCLAESGGSEVEVHWITGQQNWAVPVVLKAGLSLSPAGPICMRGALGPLTPYLPSGPFLWNGAQSLGGIIRLYRFPFRSVRCAPGSRRRYRALLPDPSGSGSRITPTAAAPVVAEKPE